jgi:hypothetical protein
MAKTPKFTAFLQRAFPDRLERAYAKHTLGRWANGRTRRPIILTGMGATGKTTLQTVLLKATDGLIHSPITTSPYVSGDMSVIVIRMEHQVPVAEMDLRLAKVIIADELDGVREWLGIRTTN